MQQPQNEKNQLQEYTAKRGLTNPWYDPKRLGGPDHAPVWQSTVTLWDGTTFTGERRGSRIAAEKSAAGTALQHLLTITIEQECDYPEEDGQTVLLIDMENKPKLLSQLNREQLRRVRVYVFVGEAHDLVNTQLPRGVTRIVSPSTRRDGTDCCMQVYTGVLLSQSAYKEYLIATSDHFGASLVDMIQGKTDFWPTAKARVVTLPEQV